MKATAEHDAEYVRIVAAAMRESGVECYGSLKLFPLPPDVKISMQVSTPEQQKDRVLDREARQRDTMFAASHVKPTLPGKK